MTFELLTFIAEQFHLQFHNGFSMVTFFMLQSFGQSPSLPLWIGPKSHSQKLKRGEIGIASPVLFDHKIKISLKECARLTEC